MHKIVLTALLKNGEKLEKNNAQEEGLSLLKKVSITCWSRF